MSDLFEDIRRHAGAPGGKFLHENVVLAAVEEILAQQSLDSSPVSYMGALMLSLQAESGAEPAVYGAVLRLLERTLAHVPTPLLVSKAARISQVVVAVANAQVEQQAVLKPALGCVQRLLGAQPEGTAPSSDALKLFRWLLEFTHHASPKVRQRGQQVCVEVLRDGGAQIAGHTAKFVETRLAATQTKDVQPTLHLLNFVRSALPLLPAVHATAVVQALVRLLTVAHPLLSRHTLDALLAAVEQEEEPLPAAALTLVIDSLLPQQGAGTLRVCAAAASALASVDRPACTTRLPLMTSALLKAIVRQQEEPGASSGAGGAGAGSADDLPRDCVAELLRACVAPGGIEESQAAAVASALRAHVAPRHLPAWGTVFEASGALFAAMGAAAHPSCSELLTAIAEAYAEHRMDGGTRGALVAALGQGAKALGPEAFLSLLPIKVATNEGSPDSSWLLSVLNGHIGRSATLAHFGSYFVGLQEWLSRRSTELRDEGREVESANLRHLYVQVWALFPGYCCCARDVAASFGGIARTLGAAITSQPEVRPHVLQGLTMLVLSQRAHKQPTMQPDGTFTSSLTPEAAAALQTVGSFAKNFMPILFTTHQAEPPEKQRPLQEAIGALASVAPAPLLADFFKAVMRKLLEAAAAQPEAVGGDGGGGGAGGSSADEEQKALNDQRGLLELLMALAPSLPPEHVAMLWRAVKPQLQHPDVAMQKKAYKVVASLAEAHPAFARESLAELREALEAAAAVCNPASKRQRLASLQRLLLTLGDAEVQHVLPSVLGEVVLATKEANVKTRAAAFDLLLALAAAAEKRAGPSEEAKAEAVRGLLVMVAAGVAGTSAHMMSAAVLALARLVYAYRARESMLMTSVQLLETVCSLLQHKAQEVVRAAITFCKVALSALPLEHVERLLPNLVPPLLTWCSNKHPHLKTQVRYLMERMVKRFGHDAMMAVTPEAHQRLLTHMRKQKVRASNHAAKRIAAREAAGGGADGDDDHQSDYARHADFEDLLEEEDDDGDGLDDGDGDAMDDVGSGGKDGPKVASGVRRAKRLPRSQLGLRETWQDRGDAGKVVDLLDAPLVEPSRGGAAAPGGRRVAGGKRGREDDDDGGDGVRLDADSGKLVVTEGGSASAVDRAGSGGGFAGNGLDMEVDAEDEIVRPGTANVRMTKKRRSLGQAVVQASAAEEAEGRAGSSGKKSLNDLKARRQAQDHFGAQLGEQYKSKKGAAGDVKRADGPNPFAYLPLNPRMLGKRQQRNVKTTISKFVAPKGAAAKAARASGKGPQRKHGIEARRLKGKGDRKPHKAVR